MSALYALYKLHKLDSALYSLKMEAEALDLGQAERQELEGLKKLYEDVGGRAKAMTTEIKDREIEQKGIAQKIQSITKKIFDGSVVSPKEIENLQKEIVMLETMSEKNDERLLELYDASPSIVSEAEAIKTQIDDATSTLQTKVTEAKSRHEKIKEEFDGARSERKSAASIVEPALLAQYEAVRKRTGSTAMSEVSESHTCEHCGMSVPVKQLEMIKEDKATVCEGCHRILFMVVPG